MQNRTETSSRLVTLHAEFKPDGDPRDNIGSLMDLWLEAQTHIERASRRRLVQEEKEWEELQEAIDKLTPLMQSFFRGDRDGAEVSEDACRLVPSEDLRRKVRDWYSEIVLKQMAKRKYPPTAERVGIFQAAWREIAAEASFAGMTLAEFETQTAPLTQSLQRLQALDAQYAAEMKARGEADAAARETMRLIAHAVRGNPAYGEDSSLYRAMGFVPLSERQSGLTRKSVALPPPAGAA
jgi:DNA repair exonuclease SbcCD ATPase subunit